jgi:hypothetical protein
VQKSHLEEYNTKTAMGVDFQTRGIAGPQKSSESKKSHLSHATRTSEQTASPFTSTSCHILCWTQHDGSDTILHEKFVAACSGFFQMVERGSCPSDFVRLV